MAVGTQFGPFTLLRKLARGGMAELFVANMRTGDSEQLCVIKMMLPDSLRNPRALAWFLGEARLAERLNHPNVVRIITTDRVDDYHFIAMEYIPGENLHTVLQQATRLNRPIQAEEASAIILQVCRGLEYAHTLTDSQNEPLHIVHRDISTSNIILAYSGMVKIVDFGIAAAANRHIKVPPGRALGKFAYMAPELCRGEMLDRRADIFSTGVVFWRLLTGQPLFAGENNKAIASQILAGNYPPPSLFNPEVPAAIDEVVMKSLAFDPEDRFQDVESFSRSLEQASRHLNLPGVEQLGRLPVELFGPQRRDLSLKGEIGEELDLANLLFDDIEPQLVDLDQKPERNRHTTPARLSRVVRLTALAAIGLAVLGLLGLLLVPNWLSRGTDSANTPTGLIEIDSTPRGARIHIDGKDTGQTTPARFDRVPVGRAFTIVLTAPEHEDWQGRIRLDESQPRRIHARLSPISP